MLLLQALLEHWPETFTGAVEDGDQELPRADSPGEKCVVQSVSQSLRIKSAYDLRDTLFQGSECCLGLKN